MFLRDDSEGDEWNIGLLMHPMSVDIVVGFNDVFIREAHKLGPPKKLWSWQARR